MQLTIFTTATFVAWLVLWAIGEKPIDAFIFSSVFLLIGLALHIMKNYAPNRDQA